MAEVPSLANLTERSRLWDRESRIGHDIGDFCDRIMANALRAPSLSSASPIEPLQVSTKCFNRLSEGENSEA